MAAVAAEPAGAASVPTAATAIDDTGPLEPGPGKTIYSGDDLPTDVRREYAAVSDPAGPGGLKDGDVVEECGHVGPAAGTTAPSPPRTTDTEENTELFPNDTPTLPEGAGEPFSPGPVEYRSVMTDSQPSAVFLLSFPAHPAAPEAGLSLAEPAEPTTNVTANDYYQNRADPLIVLHDSDLSYTSLTAEDARPPDNSSSSSMPTEHTEDARVDTVPGRSPDRTSSPVGTATIMDIEAAATDHSTTSYGGFSRTQPTCCVVDSDLTPSNPPVPESELPGPGSPGSGSPIPGSPRPGSPRPGSSCPSPPRGPGESMNIKQEVRVGESTPDEESKPDEGSKPDEESKPEPLSVEQLSAGSEVRVSLDHIIDDALVVSFRLGEKVFSGVLMDLSRRFGPYGIPITVFPERSKPAPSPAPLPSQEADGAVAETPPPPRTSKPPPLFQDGAPYPPPLLIRDSYNQALPQPPPRKIKRPKRRYRFEDPPTSIMNAIKLRPRQLLCDKCKGLVSTGGGGAPREARRGGGGGGGGGGAEEASRRRRHTDAAASSTAAKQLRTEVKPPPPSCSGRVLRAPPTRRLKATRPVLKKPRPAGAPVPPAAAPAAPGPLPPAGAPALPGGGARALTRAAALQEATQHQKVHFTRRLQQLGPPPRAPLPPRLRIKPQRYRTDDPAPAPLPPAMPPPAPNPAPSPSAGVASVAVVLKEQQEEAGGEVRGGSLLLCVAFKAPAAPPASSSSPSPPSASSSLLLGPPLKGPGSEDGPAPPGEGRSRSGRRCGAERGVCVGDIVWAKISGFPWWPAQLAPFLESFQSRFDRKRRGPYRRAVTEAARAATPLPPGVRSLLTQLEA
ncbi:unnamed protein product [Arctogadus glacialis]